MVPILIREAYLLRLRVIAVFGSFSEDPVGALVGVDPVGVAEVGEEVVAFIGQKMRLVDGYLEWRALRDDKQTNERRKELGIKVTKR